MCKEIKNDGLNIWVNSKKEPKSGINTNIFTENTYSKKYDIIHSIRPSLFNEVSDAFLIDSRENKDYGIKTGWIIGKDEKIDFGTYFNSFYISNYEQLIGPKDYYIFIQFKGMLQCKINCINSEGEIDVLLDRKIISSDITWEMLQLPEIISAISSNRITLEFVGISKNSNIENIYICSESNDLENPDLFIVLRTLKRKRDCYRVIKRLIADDRINRKYVKLIVLDSSDEIDKSDFELYHGGLELTVLKSKNFGSSGNLFLLSDYLRKKNLVKEDDLVLIIDDDIVFDTESVIRSYNLLKNSTNRKTVIASAFLDKCRPLNIDSTIGIYENNKNSDYGMRLVPLRGGNQITNPRYLDYSSKLIEGNIAAFYFLMLTADAFLKIYPMPFFLKWDDIDYSYRLYKSGSLIVNVPGIAIWHDAFYDCMPSWQEVLNLRHGLISDIIHLDITWDKFINTAVETVYKHLLVHDYDLCLSMIDAISSVFKGPSEDMSKGYFMMNQKLITELASVYKNNILRSKIEIPDINSIFTNYDDGSLECKINNIDYEIVHELFPKPKNPELESYIKFSRKSERFYTTHYNAERNCLCLKLINELYDSKEDFDRIKSSWGNASKLYTTNNNWLSITGSNE